MLDFPFLVTPTGLKILRRYVQWIKYSVCCTNLVLLPFHRLRIKNSHRPEMQNAHPKGEHFTRVTPTGFKPVTAGAEIQCAIQLRHGAIWGRWCDTSSKGQLRHGAILKLMLFQGSKITEISSENTRTST